MPLTNDQRLTMLTPPPGRLPVVLDTDTYNEIDDQFAVVHALLSPERLDVQAIYAVLFHNARSTSPGHGMELSYEEILRLLERLRVPSERLAFRGVTEPVGLGHQGRRAPAVDDMIERALQGRPERPLYVLAIGALSNVASAILAEPRIVERMVVVWMSCNAPDWPREFALPGDFNLEQDVGAAQVVLDSGVPVVFVPALPVSSHLTSTVPEIERHVEPHGAVGAFLAARFKAYNADHFGWSKRIWDLAAIAWMLDSTWCPSVIVPTPIVSDDMRWTTDPRRHPMRYVAYVNRDAILRDFVRKLSTFAAQAS